MVAWAPDPDGEVLALAVHGNTLYVGGYFTHIGEQARNYVAAIDLQSGRTTDWDPGADLQVRALFAYGSCLYVGGDFSNIGGEVRHSVAALDLATGKASAWNPDLGGSIRAFAALGDTIYVGGSFGNPRTIARALAAVSASTGMVGTWDARLVGLDAPGYDDPRVYVLGLRGDTLYVGGHFTGICGEVRGGLAQIDLATKQATAWNPDPGPWTGGWNRDIRAMALADTTVYVGGYFESIAGQWRNFVAEVGLTTGLATAWNPNANSAANALGVSDGAVYVGGFFTGIGPEWQHRRCLAAFDATTGAVRDWDPNLDGLSAGPWS